MKRGKGKKGGVKINPIKRANHLRNKKGGGPQQKSAKFSQKSSKATVTSKNTKKQEQRKEKLKRLRETSAFRRQFEKNSQPGDENADDIDDSILDMIDPEDLTYIQRSSGLKSQPKRKKLAEDAEDVADEYEEVVRKKRVIEKPMKPMLPIKSSEGLIPQSVEIKEEDEEEEEAEPEEEEKAAKLEETPEVFTAAELYARRQAKLADMKIRIGSLAASLLENPEERVTNLVSLVKLLDDPDQEVYITVRKLACQTLVEVFRDLAPGFEIKHTNEGGKLKKDTAKVYAMEDSLLKQYRLFLKKLEEFFSIFKRKSKANQKPITEAQRRVGVFALKCMGDLLTALPYFNYAKNIVQAMVPFAGHADDEIRQPVCDSFKKVFKEDKRGEITLHIVKQVNHLIKNERHRLHPDCLATFLALRLHDINLDKEKEEEIARHRTLNRKQKLLALSKKERKRSKKIERLQKELVAAKAEESKETKTKFFTEVTKTVFTVYFRVLKMGVRSGLLGVVLEGLAKFAHAINVDFFTDLVTVLSGLLASDKLDLRQCLQGVQVVLRILSGQGEMLLIDPLQFYGHLYRLLLEVTAGYSHGHTPIVLDCLDAMLIQRRKKVSQPRVLAFAKRVATIGLQMQQNGAIAMMSFMRQMLMTHRYTELLLDPDSGSGSGIFMPELTDPEHCNAGSTALYELHALTRHFHPTVRKYAQHVLLKLPANGNGILPLELTRKTPTQLFDEYDGSHVAFNPPVAHPDPPAKIAGHLKKFSTAKTEWASLEFRKQCEKVLKEVN